LKYAEKDGGHRREFFLKFPRDRRRWIEWLYQAKKRYSGLSVLNYMVTSNHLLVKMIPENRYTDEQIQKRFETFYGDSRDFAEGQIPYLREKLSSLSEFMREIKVGFARYYNRRHNRRGYFWGDRFKSVIVD
jgi:hypothetical protein